ncbi:MULTISPECIES: BMC domain-containing protein [unclassified Romboutsia]|uniref:BMC domain-containing protein n=1 Tax=unclassified Romboutsia TaxID=2626894 RepID=UPI00189A5F42|nr:MULTISPECIES: BMC domain-containing protein [unclassified Romboutsia]MDB8804868.1 BMC domain-containing protein [Romboutsia sp. 1001216sp1]MDB8808183.1 BMC domain-containing protein [Romboutsia sp. 1001216sp1]MDB8810514.1 BMC domain-containing protein [Romboutsia sp. 1001216sp1]MDB8816233.1 BMC domain-containing protein [Romboutsia sp. 1001216sp1]MDB8818813.1 BMC domain-containing protein [Romboutsia sp. 1001216sp1]
MSQLAIGIIETIGLAACIEAADVCVKSANVNLIGYELSKGGGMATLKIEGNVGAVKAAIEASVVAANKISKVFSYKIIPRPSKEIDILINNKETIGYKEIQIDNQSKENVDLYNEDDKELVKDIVENVKIVNLEDDLNYIKSEELGNTIEENNLNNKENYTCNLCKDPECKRQKGELKNSCIHYNELNDFKEE